MDNQASYTYLKELRAKICKDSSDLDLAPDYDTIASELLNVIDCLLPSQEDILPGREEDMRPGRYD